MRTKRFQMGRKFLSAFLMLMILTGMVSSNLALLDGEIADIEAMELAHTSAHVAELVQGFEPELGGAAAEMPADEDSAADPEVKPEEPIHADAPTEKPEEPDNAGAPALQPEESPNADAPALKPEGPEGIVAPAEMPQAAEQNGEAPGQPSHAEPAGEPAGAPIPRPEPEISNRLAGIV